MPPPPGVRGAGVWLARDSPLAPFGARLRIEMTWPAPEFNRADYAFDGATTYGVWHADRTLTRGDTASGAPDLIEGSTAGDFTEAPFVRMARMVRPALEAGTAVYEGEETLGGVPTRRVRTVRDLSSLVSGSRQAFTWWFGAEDGLLRQREEVWTMNGLEQWSRFAVSHLVLHDAFPDTLFALALPEGYTEEPYQRREGPDPFDLLATGTPAPDFRLPLPSGDSLALADLRGRVSVLDFWGTWCGPCVISMPKLAEAAARLDSLGVTVYAVSAREPEGADPQAMLDRYGLRVPLVLHGERITEAYGVRVYPTLYVLDEDGRVLYASLGYNATEGYAPLVARIEAHLRGEPFVEPDGREAGGGPE